MKAIRIAATALICAALSARSAALSAQDGPDDRAKLLAAVDDLLTFDAEDLSAEIRVEQSSPGGGTSTTVAALFRRDRKGQYLILVLEPEIDKGKGYLKMDDSVWLYDPVGRRFTFSSAKERFEGTGASNSDFSGSTLAKDYRVAASKREKLGAYECDVLDLEARNDRVAYPKKRIWISTDGLLRKYEDYSLSGKLMRTTAIPAYQKKGATQVPSTLVVLDHLKSKVVNGKTQYERTTVTLSKISLEKLPDIMFTKEYLEKVNR